MTRFRLEGHRSWASAMHPKQSCPVRLLIAWEDGKLYGDPFMVRVIKQFCKPGYLLDSVPGGFASNNQLENPYIGLHLVRMWLG